MKKVLVVLVTLAIISFLIFIGRSEHFVNEIKVFIFFEKLYPSVLNFGDVMFDRGVRNIIENRGRDPLEYIKKDLNLLKGYDVFVVNLEGPIVTMDRGLCQQKAYNFQFASDTPDRLKSIGVNMVTIANNHTYDCLKVGFESTKQNLIKAGIEYMGDSDVEKSYVVKEIDGKKIAFVGIDETVQTISLSEFYPLIKKLDAENDLVVVNIHWGTEYKLTSNENQKAIARRLVDSGADVIFGHHPHVIEEVEVYKGRAIFYSLGNFVFDQNFGDTTVGLGVGVEFREDKTVFKLFPFNIKIFAPDLMKGQERENFCVKYLSGLKNKNCSFSI